MRENIQLIVIVGLIFAWYVTALAGLKQRNKYFNLIEKYDSKINTLGFLNQKIENLEKQSKKDKEKIEVLEKSILEYKAKISKISSYFKG